jgi:hypothetical protein
MSDWPWLIQGFLFFAGAVLILSLIEAIREGVRLIRRKWDL